MGLVNRRDSLLENPNMLCVHNKKIVACACFETEGLSMKPEETVDFHIRWAWAKISRLYNHEAAKFSGTMSIGYALLNVDKEGTPSTQLGPKMGMESRSLTRTLKTMEDQGLIRRKSDEVDRRRVLVYLTKEGLRLREETRSAVLHFNQFIQDRIDGDKLRVFAETISEINQILDQNNIFEDYKSKVQSPFDEKIN